MEIKLLNAKTAPDFWAMEMAGHFRVGRDTRSVDGRNRAGEADCRHAIAAHGHGINHPVVEQRALDGRLLGGSEREKWQQEAKEISE